MGAWASLMGATQVSCAAGPAASPMPSPASLELRIEVLSPQPSMARIDMAWALRNTSAHPVRVASHVIAGPLTQFDQLTLKVCEAGQSRCQSVLFETARSASMPVQCLLQAGQTMRHELDLAAWLEQQGIPLHTGVPYELQATYQQTDSQGIPSTEIPLWTGSLTSNTVGMTLLPRPSR